MKVGDLVRIIIVDDHPLGVITKIDMSIRWGGPVYSVHSTCPLFGPHHTDFLEHQLELFNESR